MVRLVALLAPVVLSAGLRAAEPAGLKPSIPAVQQIFPQSWMIGQSVRVTLWGEFLDRAQALQFDSDAFSGSVLESSFTTATVLVSSSRLAHPGFHTL